MPRPWTVLPHGPLEKLEPNLWAVEGTIRMPAGELSRRMCIARLGDGRLLLMNGVPLREEAMREVEAFGKPSFLLVPNGYHRLGIAAFKQRYPQLRVLARWFIVGDRAVCREHLLRLAGRAGLRRMIPCHGGIVQDDAPPVLPRVA